MKSQLRRYTSLGDINASNENVILNGRLALQLRRARALRRRGAGEADRHGDQDRGAFDAQPGAHLPAEEIYSKIWNESAYSTENTVMVHIRRIREKIELNPSEPEYLKVVWGIGYKMEKH